MRSIALAMVLVLPVASSSAAEEVSLRASLYYAAMQDDYAPGMGAAFLDKDGRAVALGSPEFLEAASVEGTAAFSDGRVFNHHVLVDDEVRWMPTSSRFGLDARGCDLVPFRSAAVDPAVVPLGSRLFIAQTEGMPLPDGGRHDGVWIATDIGGGIDGRRIDLFTGRGLASMERFEDHGITYLRTLNVVVTGGNLPCPQAAVETKNAALY